jgi:hypothetical protein
MTDPTPRTQPWTAPTPTDVVDSSPCLDEAALTVLAQLATGQTWAGAATAAGLSTWQAKDRVQRAQVTWGLTIKRQVVVRALRQGLI